MAATVIVYLLSFPIAALLGDENPVSLGESETAQAVEDIVELNPSSGHQSVLLGSELGTPPGLGPQAN
jgi:hypothetical protein